MSMDQRRILRPFLKIRSTLSELPENPAPQEVHKLRIRLRRLEAALDALDLDSRPIGRGVLRHSRPLRRRCGKIHDMDVLTALAASLEAKDCGSCRIELLEYLGAERYRRLRRLQRAVSKHKGELRRGLKRCLTRIERRIGRTAPTHEKVMAAATITARIFELGMELARYPRLSQGNLHYFRVRAKHLRYILQMAGESGTPLFCALDAAKDSIGDWHDWQQLSEIARRLDGHPGRRTLLSELRAITATKFREAMEASQRLRAEHLARLYPASRPALLRPRRALSSEGALAA